MPAYSTLGKLRDPVLSSMLSSHEDDLTATLIHELAHQRLYLPGDTMFNESFATAVASVGLERWLMSRDAGERLREYRARREVNRAFLDLAEAARRELASLYASSLDEEAMRERKAQVFAGLAAEYDSLAAEYGMRAPVVPANNAALVPLASYHGLVPAFRGLLAACDGKLECFYAEAERIAAIDDEVARRAVLERALSSSGPPYGETANSAHCDPSS